MGSSIKINSISIDLAGAANETDMVKCDHFSIRGYVAETRERDYRKCWPFSEESVSYPLPSLTVPKSRWWRCMSCIKDIDADGTKGLHANSTSISGEKLEGTSSVIPSQNKVNLQVVIDQEKEKENDIAGNVVVENEDVNCERSQKDDQTATTLVKKVHPPSKGASTIRNKTRKLASGQQVGNKRSKVSKSSTDKSSWKEKQNVDQAATFASSEIAGVVEDTPPKAVKNHKDSSVDNVSSESINLGFQRRKTRKVRLLSELIVDPETKGSKIRQEESSSSKVRGRKRKVPPENNYASRKLSTAGAASDQGDSESTDSGFDRDLIRGKKKNRRFQVVDEFVPSLPSQEGGVHENDAGPSKSVLSKEKDSVPQRTEKKLKKKKNKPVMDNGFSSGPSINTSSQSTRDLLNEERVVGSSLDDRLAAEGYFRKPILPQVKDRPVTSLHGPENAHVRSSDAEANCLQESGSSSRPNTGGWLRTGVDSVDFSTNNNNAEKGLADLSSVLQKDASGADRKGKTVMVQEHQGALGNQSNDRNENTAEDQNDDITLEIAELMAKNQYERCLPDKEEDLCSKQPPQEETAHRSKNALLIDLNETYDNETSLEDNNNNTSRPQQKPLDFFPLRQPYVPSPFGIFPPPTQETRANSIRFSSGHNNPQWLGNAPAMANQHSSPSSYRVLRGCNTCYQSVPHQYREPASHSSHPSWPPSIVRPQCHHPPVSFNMDQSARLGMLSQAPPPRSENTWNLNFVTPNGKQKCDGNRSMDAYSNESSIPALNLLSLMDPRLRSNAPAEHHGNTHFSRRHFPPVNQSKERVGLETGDSSKIAYPSKQSPFNFYSNGFAPEGSRKSFPIGPPLGTSSFSFLNAQADPWSHHHHQEQINKSKNTMFPSSNDQGRFQLLRGSNSMKLPLKEMNQKRKAESSSNASALPPKNSSGSIVCSVNRNPADFTVAEPGNVYMLTSENLKVRKRAPYKTKASLCKEDAMKQTKKTVGPVTENA